MPKKKTPNLDPKEQFKRFQEAAKKAGVEEASASNAFKKLSLTTKPKSRPANH
jgi:hypothetical protein